MLTGKKIILIIAGVLLNAGALLLLIGLSMSYGDETELLENDAFQRFERGVAISWWLWWGLQTALLVWLLYRFVKQLKPAPRQLSSRD